MTSSRTCSWFQSSAPPFPLSSGTPTTSDCRNPSLKFYFINSSMNVVQVHFPARFLSVKPQLCTGFQWLHLTLLQACLGREPGLHRSTVSSQKCFWICKSSAFKYPHLQDCSWKNEMKGFKNKKNAINSHYSSFFHLFHSNSPQFSGKTPVLTEKTRPTIKEQK